MQVLVGARIFDGERFLEDRAGVIEDVGWSLSLHTPIAPEVVMNAISAEDCSRPDS